MKHKKRKRKALLILSIIIGLICVIASYTQINYRWTNDGIWWVIYLFGGFSLLGIFVSLFCKDYWVSLVLGNF